MRLFKGIAGRGMIRRILRFDRRQQTLIDKPETCVSQNPVRQNLNNMLNFYNLTVKDIGYTVRALEAAGSGA
jgi:hypothetical protein